MPLHDALLRAQARGLLGPGPVDVQVAHARSFVHLVAHACGAPARWIDVGSGGGLPGLVAALAWPDSSGVLLDARGRATEALEEACAELRLGHRVQVVTGRAEALGRDPTHREAYEVVLARAVASPAVTAELCAPLARVGGAVAVSERVGGDVWSGEAAAELGLDVEESRTDGTATVRILRKVGLIPDRYPRRVGIPAKRPLW